MKAIVLQAPGGTDQLIFTEMDKPVIKDDEVLVQVKAISINPVDVKSRKGKGVYGRLKDLQPLILGWDISGIIAETGSSVTGFTNGDAVFGMVNFPGHGKAYAEYVAVPAAQLAHKPSNISHEAAAAATLAALTAWQDLVTEGQVQKGQRVLIHGASGGVGHFAVQIAKQLGTYVIGISSAPNKDLVLSLGADEHIDYNAQRFEEAVSGIDFVLDTLGGDNIDRSLEVINKGGTILSIPSGISEDVKEKAAAKGIRGMFHLVQSNGSHMDKLAALLHSGALKAHIAATYPFEKMAAAHEQVDTGHTAGKVIVTL